MKKYLVSTLIIVFAINLSFTQGLNLATDELLSELPKINNDALGFVDNLPSRYSFEEYVPTVLNQKGSSCVGFATLYYALSTQYNVRFGIKDRIQIASHSFDPYYIYSMIKSRDKEDCSKGSYFDETLDILQKAGAKKMFIAPFLTCNTQWSQEKIKSVLPYTMPYSIDSWGAAIVDSEFVGIAKNALYNDYPLVFGVGVTKSLYSKSSDNNIGMSADGLWRPSNSEERLGGHAMTIVGYDDYKFGGAFRVVNSWGQDYGDNGYLWITYSDFIKNVKAAYIMYLKDEINPSNNPQMDFDNFQRIVRTQYTMEGQLNYGKFNGYGIYHSDDNNTSYMGKFINGNMDGYFLMLSKKGFFEATIRNGEFYDFEKLGFSDEDSEISENRLMAKKYFSMLDNPSLKMEAPTELEKVYKIMD